MLDYSTYVNYSSPNSISRFIRTKVCNPTIKFTQWKGCNWPLSFPEPTDYTKLWNDLRTTISLVKAGENPGPGQASFAHITGGYDAGYYGFVLSLFPFQRSLRFSWVLPYRYTYSLVFAADMYRTIFKKNPLDPKLGQRYRERILGPGGSRDETESLKVSIYCYILSPILTKEFNTGLLRSWT